MSSAKSEAKEAAPAPAGSAAAAVPAGGGGMGAWLPAIVVVLVAPAASWAVTQFVLLPKLQAKLVAPPIPGAPGAAEKAAPAKESKGEKGPAQPPTYEFSNVVVNLAGTMGTRYLKTTFMITGTDAGLHAEFDDNKAKLTDVTLNVLSALTLADLEEPGSKNILREKLVTAYNQALGHKVAEQVYFSDFVVQ